MIKEIIGMKKKLLAGMMAAALAVTAGAFNVPTVQAAETQSKYYTTGTLIDENNYTELCVGDVPYVSAGVYLTADDSAVDVSKLSFVSETEMVEDWEYPAELCAYLPDKDVNENATTFSGKIPEAAFGQYVGKIYALYVDEGNGNLTLVDSKAYSERTIHSWGGTKNITFESNGDGKTVTAYSIWKNGTTNAKIPSSIKVAGTTYKVTSVGSYALENKDIKSVTIPSSVTEIGEKAFYKANKLKTITIQGNVKSIGKKAFAGINKKAVIKIKASNSNYKKIVKLIKKSGAPKTVTYKRVK